MRKRMIGTMFVAILTLVIGGVASAALISAMDPNLSGTTSYTFADGTKVESGNDGTNRVMDTKTLAGWTGLGVSGGYVDAEIDLKDSEYIKITYRTPVTLDHITLGFLFPSGQYGDTVNEKAKIRFTYLDGHESENELEYLVASGYAKANWTGAGSITNLSPAESPNAGVWRINNPFSDEVIGLRFTAKKVGDTSSAANSDFSIVEVATANNPVPEPGTMMLLGSGLVGLAGWGRKKFRK